MKKIINIVLITILALSSLKANANVTMSTSEVKSIIAKQVLEATQKYTDAQLTVEVVAVPFKELILPSGTVSFVVKPSTEKFAARDLEKVFVYVNDKFFKTFNAPVVVKAYQDVLVASRFISREQELTPDLVKVKKLEVSNTLGYQLRPEALKNQIIAKKTFMDGEIIDKRFVKLRPDIVRNSSVAVIFNSSNLTIETEAIALSDGVVGDNICVMNKIYNKVYTGKIIGENKVLVKI